MKYQLTPRILKKLVLLAVTLAPIAFIATIAAHYLVHWLGFPPALWFTFCCWAFWGYAGFALSIRLIKNNQEP